MRHPSRPDWQGRAKVAVMDAFGTVEAIMPGSRCAGRGSDSQVSHRHNTVDKMRPRACGAAEHPGWRPGSAMRRSQKRTGTVRDPFNALLSWLQGRPVASFEWLHRRARVERHILQADAGGPDTVRSQRGIG